MERKKYDIKKIKNKDSAAIRELIDGHRDFAFNLALRLARTREDAEEIVQDAFLKAINNIDNFRGDSKFSTYLYRIIYTTYVSKYRKAEYNISKVSIDDNENYGLTDINIGIENLESEERKKIIREAMDKLNETDAFILTLFYLNEMNTEEISKITGLGRSAVKVRIFRARKKMFEVLRRILKNETREFILR